MTSLYPPVVVPAACWNEPRGCPNSAGDNGRSLFCDECNQRMGCTDEHRDLLAEAVRGENVRALRETRRYRRRYRLLFVLLALIQGWVIAWVFGWRF